MGFLMHDCQRGGQKTAQDESDGDVAAGIGCLGYVDCSASLRRPVHKVVGHLWCTCEGEGSGLCAPCRSGVACWSAGPLGTAGRADLCPFPVLCSPRPGVDVRGVLTRCWCMLCLGQRFQAGASNCELNLHATRSAGPGSAALVFRGCGFVDPVRSPCFSGAFCASSERGSG